MSEADQPQDGAAVRFPPPLVPVIGLAAGVIAHLWIWPLPLGLGAAGRYGAGGILVLAGLALMLAAIGLFRRTGQDPAPWQSTPEIISEGIYRYTRNPMYLGMGVLQAGIGLALDNAWVIVAVAPVWIAIYASAIRHEEAYLERKFGGSYADYKKAVRRWI